MIKTYTLRQKLAYYKKRVNDMSIKQAQRDKAVQMVEKLENKLFAQSEGLGSITVRTNWHTHNFKKSKYIPSGYNVWNTTLEPLNNKGYIPICKPDTSYDDKCHVDTSTLHYVDVGSKENSTLIIKASLRGISSARKARKIIKANKSSTPFQRDNLKLAHEVLPLYIKYERK